MMKIAFALLVSASIASAWVTQNRNGIRRPTYVEAAVGIYFGTSTGSTQEVAEKIYEALGDDVAAEPQDVETLDDVATAFSSHDALIVGTPTWNTGADVERSGTGWDELYYEKLPSLKSALENKKVAVFGLGDQVSYAENYADATGELFDVFEGLGCKMLGSWSQEGYEHEASKSIRGDNFCGLLLDMVNQEDLTDERVETWVAQLIDEGLLEGGDASSSGPVSAEEVEEAIPVTAEVINGEISASVESSTSDRLTQLERENEELRKMLEDNSSLLDETIGTHATGGFQPHFNAKTGKTMWTSPDGHKSFVTEERPRVSHSP